MWRRAVLVVCLCLLPTLASAQSYIGGASNNATSTGPTVTYTATNGNFLLALITVQDGLGTTTCTTPAGWTKIHADDPIYTNYVMCAATKVATGSDAYTWTISASYAWAIGVVEFSGVASATATTSATADQNTTAPSVSTAGSVASGSLMIAGLIDTNEQTLVAPTGWTPLTLSPATGVHYGLNFSAMGGLAWRTSTGGIQTSTWSQTDSHFTGVGIYAFDVSAGTGAPKRALLLGVGDQ